MTARNGILAAGNLIVDHVKIIDTWPDQDALVNIKQERLSFGGSPYNMLVDLHRLGAVFPKAVAGLVGDDPFGKLLIESFKQNSIDTSRIRSTSEAPTSYTDVMTVQKTGRRTFFHQRGANALFSQKHIDLNSSNAKIFHLAYLLLLDAMDSIDPSGVTEAARLLEAARKKGFITTVDIVSENSDRFKTVVLPSLPHIDYLVINDFEATRITGRKMNADGSANPGELEAAAKDLLSAGVKRAVIIHFPNGAVAAESDSHLHHQGSVKVPHEKILGTLGAGDAFAAGILFGVHEGWPMHKCLRLASCSAATCLFSPTSTEGVLKLEECHALGEKYGYR